MKQDIYLGIDIGGSIINIGLLTTKGEIVEQNVVPTLVEEGAKSALARIIKVIRQILDTELYQVKAIGFGIPGIWDYDKNVLVNAANLPGWENISLVNELEKKLGIKIFVENDANVAALGECWLGSGKDSNNAFIVTLGTGVGGTIILNNEIFKPLSQISEFGHMIIDISGDICNCGRRGCLETFVSKNGIQRIAKKMLEDKSDSLLKSYYPDNLSPLIISQMADKGDDISAQIFTEAAHALGIGISNIINIIGIRKIIIGGGIANAWKYLYNPLMDTLKQNVFYFSEDPVNVVPAKLGVKAGFIGAAKLAIVKHLLSNN